MKSVSIYCPLLSFLLLTFPYLLIQTAAQTCQPAEQKALLAFKSTVTSDDRGAFSYWRSGTNCCDWIGIGCDDDGHVYNLEVRDAVLSGTLSPSLSKLTFLEYFDIQNLGNMSGPFPDFLFDLTHLRSLGIGNCNLSGPLPTKIASFTNLTYLNLAGNKLSGSLPDNIGSLVGLDYLNLAGNKFSGRIPSSFTNLASLSFLDLSHNSLRCTIPDGFRNLKSLFFLWLNNNKFHGTIPDFFSSFSILGSINLSHNKLHGKIPDSLSSLAPSLLYLNLGHNHLDGNIPSFVGDLVKLYYLYLPWNNFTGVVPTTFAQLTSLLELDLSHNYLSNPFPVMNVTNLDTLDLSSNLFQLGEIPTWVATVSSSIKLSKCEIKMKLDDWNPNNPSLYRYIDLSNNEILGSPVKLLNQSNNLVRFKASGNQLKFDIGTLKIALTLQNLDLSRNLIYGEVPTNVAEVKTLNLNHNANICGSPLPPCKI